MNCLFQQGGLGERDFFQQISMCPTKMLICWKKSA